MLDESPRWLLQKGRVQEATETLERAAKINRKKFHTAKEIEAKLMQVIKVRTFIAFCEVCPKKLGVPGV